MSRILTNAGVYFHLRSPEKHKYCVKEIAHALSHICRSTGHTKWLYTVAQHAVYVSYLVPPGDALEGLHHDDSEAYLGDVSSPLKALLPAYKSLELEVEQEIAGQLGLRFPFPGTVKLADMQLFLNEKRDVMATALEEEDEDQLFKPFKGLKIRKLPIWAVKLAFLDRHAELTKEGTWFQLLRLKMSLTPLVLLKPRFVSV